MFYHLFSLSTAFLMPSPTLPHSSYFYLITKQYTHYRHFFTYIWIFYFLSALQSRLTSLFNLFRLSISIAYPGSRDDPFRLSSSISISLLGTDLVSWQIDR